MWSNDNENPDDQRSQTEQLQLKYVPASVSRQRKIRGSAIKRLFSTEMRIHRQLYNIFFTVALQFCRDKAGVQVSLVALQSHWLQHRRYGARQPPMLMSTFFMLNAVSSWEAIHHVETARSHESLGEILKSDCWCQKSKSSSAICFMNLTETHCACAQTDI